MGQITRDQSLAVVSILMTNVDWDSVDFDKAGLQDAVIRDPKGVGARFTAFLRNGARFVVSNFPVWKTVKVGTKKSVAELRQALVDAGYQIGTYASQILDKVTVAATETDIDLVNVSVGELGFDKGATRADIYKRAIELGLELVPDEVGVQLRLQYANQPKGEWLLIAMEPRAASGDVLRVFGVEHYDDGQWLNTDDGDPTDVWSATDRWVFALRKQNQPSDVGSISTL